MKRSGWAGILLFLGLLGNVCWAGTPASQDQILGKVGFVQNLGASVPLDLAFRDEDGRPVQLRRYFSGKPVILTLVYYECPMLCTETLNGLTRGLRGVSFDAGKEFNIVTVSFDPRETPMIASRKKEAYVARYGRPGAAQGWAFLTGSEESIRRLTNAVGFHYDYDAGLGQYAHPTGLLVLTPQGRVSHYFYGVEYPARDLTMALMEASSNRIGSPVDYLLLTCYHYDPLTGKYGLVIFRLIQYASIATVLLMAACIVLLSRHRRTAEA